MAADKLDKENSQASFAATAKKYPFCARIKKSVLAPQVLPLAIEDRVCL
jgi:hypothetical protein